MDKYEKWRQEMEEYYSNISDEQFSEDLLIAGFTLYKSKSKIHPIINMLFCSWLGHHSVEKDGVNYMYFECKRCGSMWMESEKRSRLNLGEWK